VFAAFRLLLLLEFKIVSISQSLAERYGTFSTDSNGFSIDSNESFMRDEGNAVVSRY
jgi:hypothetical protein